MELNIINYNIKYYGAFNNSVDKISDIINNKYYK